MSAAYIAIDWGTTNRRAYLMGRDGTVIQTHRDDCGALTISGEDYPREVEAVRARLGRLPIYAAGMVGSRQGWTEVPYVAAPCALEDIAAAMLDIPDYQFHVLPGVSLCNGLRTDVMRGEEIQVLGAIAAGAAPATALFCQPGTHNKWIATDESRIAEFSTAMTGELFALLGKHGLLSGMLQGSVHDGDAFRAGVARGAGARDLLVALFEVRAAVLLERRPLEETASFTSGLLIGADVGSQRELAGRDIQLLSGGPLEALYATAIEMLGGLPRPLDSHAAFTAGIHHLWELRNA